MAAHWIGEGLIVVFMVGVGYFFSFIFLVLLGPSAYLWRELWEKGPRDFIDFPYGGKFVRIVFRTFWLIGMPLLLLYILGAILVAAINILLADPQGDKYLVSVGLLIGFCLFLINIIIDMTTSWDLLGKICKFISRD